ncbi:MAG: hypothetical protein Q9157_002694, partial [Trypethelium eluteriae]
PALARELLEGRREERLWEVLDAEVAQEGEARGGEERLGANGGSVGDEGDGDEGRGRGRGRVRVGVVSEQDVGGGGGAE